MRVLLLFALGVAANVAVPTGADKNIDSSLATINHHPYLASLLYSSDLNAYWQKCAGTIITTTSVLTAASCFYREPVVRVQVRVGSTYANSGGTTHGVKTITSHQLYNHYSHDNDVAVIRTKDSIKYIANTVAFASIASPDYYLADNQVVWTMGWTDTHNRGAPSEQLRHDQIWSVDQATCRNRYAKLKRVVTDSMLCAGWLDVSGGDQCLADTGSPLMHNNIVVGISSWGNGCGRSRYPGVNTRVSHYTAWIQAASSY